MSVAAAVLAAAALAPAGAAASNHKVAVGGFRWSTPRVQVNLGEHVTWYWAGPDTQHSITGGTANSAGTDSDRGRDVPEHKVGDKFQVAFDQPGTYEFHCKLHPTVAGQVTVAPLPGDPTTEPDPDPVLSPDRSAPTLEDLVLGRPKRGAALLRYTLDQAATVLVEVRRGRTLVRSQQIEGHVGYNRVGLNLRGLRAGSYGLRLSASDAVGNIAPAKALRVRISRSSRR